MSNKLHCIKGIVGIGVLVLPTVIYAKSPDSIRIGLESVYKDAYTIQIKSESPLAVGYFDEERWIQEGYLESEEINVTLANQTYYSYDEVYSDLEEAYAVLDAYDSEAVVAYVEPGEYKIYTTDDFEAQTKVHTNNNRIQIADSYGEILLISENNNSPLGFRGSYNTYDFPATGVGNSRIYRGVIEVVKGQYKGLTAVNQVDMEDYLYGVVPCEMLASWHGEALKAQAVAARSMATFQYNRFLSRGYNLVDTTTSQVYRGITAEDSRSNAAVDATSGEIATYNGKVAETVYSASSGGYTADSQYVWGNAVPYLKAKPDPYESAANHVPWTRTITTKELEKCVANQGQNIGTVKGVRIEGYTTSGRVKALTILGTNGEYTVKNEATRTFFSGSNEGSLKSRMYKFTPYDEGNQVTPPVIQKPSQPESSNKVNILTSDGAVTLDLEGLWIESDATFSKVEGEVYIQDQDSVTSSIELGIGDAADNTDRDLDFKEDAITSEDATTVYGDITLYGMGYGHGVGMSQYGAKGMAEAGFDYEDIIMYYYDGVIIE